MSQYRYVISRLLGWLLLGPMVLSCAHQSQTSKTTVVEDVMSEVTAAVTPSATPDFIDQALLHYTPSENDNLTSKERRFDVSVNNIPAKSFFLGLMADTDINVVTHPEVDGRITLELKRVSVKEVLDVVRDVYGYEYRHQGSIYTIYPRKLRTEIFPINYIDIKRVGVSDTSVSIGKIQSSGSASGGGGASTDESSNLLSVGDSGDQNSGGGQGISPGSRIQTLNRTDFWRMLELTVNSMISAPAEGQSVMVNPQAGLVVVSAMPNEIHAVREFLERSELSVSRQVVLETQIVEVQLHSGFEAGINWNAIQGELHYSKNVTEFAGAQVAEAEVNGPEIFASIFKVLDIRDLLSLLETQGDVQVLSSPRVSTVNNQKAVIRVGSDEFFVTGVKNNTTSNAGSTTSSPELELDSFFSGISLDVTPQISETGDVILHIHPIVSDVNDQIKEIVVGDSKFTLPLALRDIRESDSIVRARSGQIIVLGGLMQKSSRKNDAKRPWLAGIPGLNVFFKSKKTASKKTELVILLRPVVVGANTWDDQLKTFQNIGRIMGDELRGR